MSIPILLAAALLPAVLLWLYIWRQDSNPEPTKQLVKAVLLGVAICIPVALLEVVLQYILLGGEATSLIGTRINWTPYIVQAVKAVMNDQKIENVVMGNVHVMDVGAGFDRGWVEMLELNPAIAPNGAQEVIDRTIEDMARGNCHVFHGNYIGVNPDDPSDTWNLNVEYIENSSSSAPTFYYILQDVITKTTVLS